jgi:gliding motility-associated lipoprotein GldH
MMNKVKIIISIVIFAVVNSACDRDKVYEEYVKIDNYVWNNSEIVKFDFNIEDSISLYNLYINVRHATLYPYNNLWLFVKSYAPNGVNETDTIECVLAEANGKWKGDGLGDIWDFQQPWKQNVRFPRTGKYHIEMEQAMRTESLSGIMDMGLRVEKVELR